MSETRNCARVKPTSDTPRSEPIIKLQVIAETWRCRAYLAFWGMCLFAITVTNVIVAPKLKEGPTAYGMPEGSTCGPFNRPWKDESPNPVGILPGQGFDVKTQTHLSERFGFPNICTNWDYTPAREMTAVYYPLFEYSLIVYLCLDFVVTMLARKRGEIGPRFYTWSKILFPVNVFLCTMFRMIFVFLAYEATAMHTMGFLCLQTALVLVAIQNTLFVLFTKQGYDVVGGVKNTQIAAKVYLTLLLIVSSMKVSATIYIVMHGKGAPWTLVPSFYKGEPVGWLVDKVWMLFNAVIPLLIAWVRSKNEGTIHITITEDEPKYMTTKDGSTVAEMQPLKNAV